MAGIGNAVHFVTGEQFRLYGRGYSEGDSDLFRVSCSPPRATCYSRFLPETFHPNRGRLCINLVIYIMRNSPRVLFPYLNLLNVF